MSDETLEQRIAFVDAEEQMLYGHILARTWATAEAMKKANKLDYMKLAMDLLLCHKLHCPMRLREWLAADHVAFITDAMAIYHNFQGTPIYALRDGVSLHFAVSNASRIWVPSNFSHQRSH